MSKCQSLNPIDPFRRLGILVSALVFMLGCRDDRRVTTLDPGELNSREVGKPASDIPDPIAEMSQPSVVPIAVSVSVKISGFGSNKGKCCVAAYLTSKEFNKPEFAYRKETLDIEGDSANWNLQLELNQEEMAKYFGSDAGLSLAISAYHDNNGNAKLDKNALGMPTERYGFSRNPKHGFGPPKFAEAVILVSEQELKTSKPFQLEVPIEVN